MQNLSIGKVDNMENLSIGKVDNTLQSKFKQFLSELVIISAGKNI